jgi:hypothetical protein
VIVIPRDNREWLVLTEFLRHRALVMPTPDTHCIGWVSDGKLVCVVAMQGFLGKVCQMHVAYMPGWHYTPRALLREVFRHAFVTTGREMVLGVVNSKNVKALRMDAHLGFRELYRLHGMHDDGGDLVLLGMIKDDCRYLDEPSAMRLGEEHGLATVH